MGRGEALLGHIMKKICIFNQKGGVGKTTTNINLCAYLALEGYKVLTIDIDPQGNTTSGLGLDKNNLDLSVYDVLISDATMKESIVRSDLVQNLFISPSTMELAGAEVELINNSDRENIMKKKLEDIESEYDYVFIDCPPSLGVLTINALTCADSVLIPIQCEFYALEGVSQLINTIQLVKKSLNKNLDIEGVIMTMFDYRTNLSAEVLKEVQKYFKDKVYKTTIPRNVRLAEAPSFGLPIMLYDEKCKGAEAYVKLTKEFLKKQ
ncbi:sporulation initiation inhibitor protein Soj [Clostridium sp. BL-8]|nr:sporulation initiation inhibitor protein Soj [Clostridium sp. BL-8]